MASSSMNLNLKQMAMTGLFLKSPEVHVALSLALVIQKGVDRHEVAKIALGQNNQEHLSL